MKHRRVWISLFTVCALLAQTLAWALPMDVNAAAQQSTEQAMPCHDTQDEAPTNCCCDESCDCAAMCSGGFALLTSAALPALIPTTEVALSAVATAVIPAHKLTPLRPPITLQS